MLLLAAMVAISSVTATGITSANRVEVQVTPSIVLEEESVPRVYYTPRYGYPGQQYEGSFRFDFERERWHRRNDHRHWNAYDQRRREREERKHEK